jgi:hypothetical protein
LGVVPARPITINFTASRPGETIDGPNPRHRREVFTTEGAEGHEARTKKSLTRPGFLARRTAAVPAGDMNATVDFDKLTFSLLRGTPWFSMLSGNK